MKIHRSSRTALAVLSSFLLPMQGLPAQNLSDPDLLVYEGFDYDTGGSLELLDGGKGWKTEWLWRNNFAHGGVQVLNSALIEPGSLGYGDLAVSGNHVRLTGVNGQLELGRAFAETVGGVAGTSTYFSFVGQRVGPPAEPSSAAIQAAYPNGYPWGENLYPRGASVRFWNTGERLSIGNYSNLSTNTWSIFGSGLPIIPTEEVFTEAPAFVVARIDHKERGGAEGDNIYVWINPDLDLPEDTSTADIQVVNAEEKGSPAHVGELTWIGPFAGNASLDSLQRPLRPHAEMLVDEIRVGLTYASVTPVQKLWGGFDWFEGDFVYTGSFLQWLHTTEIGWNWSFSLESWHFLPEARVGAAGAWVYVVNYSGEEPDGGTGAGFWEGYAVGTDGTVDTGRFLKTLNVEQAPWVWSNALDTWIYINEGALASGRGYVYVFDTNGVDGMPGKPIGPVPADGEDNTPFDDGVATLEWRAGQRASSHRVYFGKDPAAVAAATPDSPDYLGEVSTHSIEVAHDFYSMERYFWRVDAVNSAGVETGNVWSFRPAQLAFPGAEGWGRYALGGRHGRVVYVTNLDDSGPGSLRAAIEDEEGPRIVVFEVGGIITLERDLTINSETQQITIAGQTAPYPGITIRNQKFAMSGARDAVMRFLRLKVSNMSGETSDGTGMSGSNNSIMDHLSVGWSLDEAFSSRTAHNITLQRTMLKEALNQAGHKNYPVGSRHGFAASVGGDVASFHHNLLAHCAGRNWSMAGGLVNGVYAGRLDFTNNVVYNWDNRTTDGGAHEVNFVANYYKGGPATRNLNFLNPQHEKLGTSTQRYYVEGNIMDVVPIPGINDRQKYVGPENQSDGYTTDSEFPFAYVDEPFFDNHVETQSARLAYKLVLSDVGANQPTADDHDYRIIGEVLDRTFTFRGSNSGLPGLIDNENDVGAPWAFYEPSTVRPANYDTDRDGLPNWYELAVGSNPNSPLGDFSDTRSDPDRDGFTLMDDYLAWLAAPHFECEVGDSVEVDLADLTRGFTASPTYTIDATVNGGAVVLLDGFTAKFTPTAGFTGLAEFTFTVTDAEGDSMTRTVGVRVKAATSSVTTGIPDGYATLNGGTTGGGEATPITVSTAEAFRTAVAHDNPAVIIVEGRLNVGNVTVGSNKTIIGADENAGLYGGVVRVRGHNYIFKYLSFGPSHDDAMEISGATNVFVYKCEFFDSSDELCSIVRGADFVTIAWSKFYFLNPDSHSFAHLIGNSDGATGDRGKLRVTLHHNWYSTDIRGRQPRVRFGQVHLYNNYFNNPTGGYCVGVGFECQIRMENLVFENARAPWADYGGTKNGKIGWANLAFINCTQPTFMPNTFPVFEPPYEYVMHPIDEVKAVVMAGAGNKRTP